MEMEKVNVDMQYHILIITLTKQILDILASRQ
jgi:hypothetical protein